MVIPSDHGALDFDGKDRALLESINDVNDCTKVAAEPSEYDQDKDDTPVSSK